MTPAFLFGKGRVLYLSDTEHDVLDAVAFAAAVVEDLPGLQRDKYVLDASSDLLRGMTSPVPW